MSIFNRSTDLRNIRCKEDFITLMSKGSGINYIGVQVDSGINIIKDIVYDYIHTLFEREMALLTSITPTQMCYKLNSIINGYNYEVITYETYLTIQFKDIPHRINIQYYPTHGIDSGLFEYNFRVVVHLPSYKIIDTKTVKMLHRDLSKSNLTLIAPYPGDDDISLKTFVKLRRYINNMGFILYDTELGDTCFIDIINNKYVVGVIREEVQRL